MIETINFYCVLEPVFLRTICKLLEKCYSSTGLNSIVFVPNNEMEELLDKSLWSFSSTSFIPHGCSADSQPHKHPIYITCNIADIHKNLNKAEILVIVNNHDFDINNMTQFRRVLLIFEDQEINKLHQKELYEKFKQRGYMPQYFQQDQKMQWKSEQKI